MQSKNYIPQRGDIIFLDWNSDKIADHVGLIEKVSENIIYTIEGNRGNKVSKEKYTIGQKCILGIAIPKYSSSEFEYPTLKKGSIGNYVKILQEKLINKDYTLKKYGKDGIFGNETEEAVKKFQEENNLVVDGIVGVNTWNMLLKMQYVYPKYLLKNGMTDINIKIVQKKLKELKYYEGSIDGIFGKETEEAVKNFKQRII